MYSSETSEDVSSLVQNHTQHMFQLRHWVAWLRQNTIPVVVVIFLAVTVADVGEPLFIYVFITVQELHLVHTIWYHCQDDIAHVAVVTLLDAELVAVTKSNFELSEPSNVIAIYHHVVVMFFVTIVSSVHSELKYTRNEKLKSHVHNAVVYVVVT